MIEADFLPEYSGDISSIGKMYSEYSGGLSDLYGIVQSM